MTKFNFNQQATEALEDLLDTNALEVRISLCNDITDKILSGDDFSDEELQVVQKERSSLFSFS